MYERGMSMCLRFDVTRWALIISAVPLLSSKMVEARVILDLKVLNMGVEDGSASPSCWRKLR